MENQSIMGIVLHFDEIGFSRVSEKWENDLIPALRKVISTYNDLGMGNFDQETFTEIANNGSKTINPEAVEQRYKSAVEEDIQKFKKGFKALSTVVVDINSETEALINFREACRAFNSNLSGLGVYDLLSDIHLEDCEIRKGEPIVDLEPIKKRFTTAIDSEDKEQFYTLLQEAANAYNRLRDFVDANSQLNQFHHTKRDILSLNVIPGMDQGFLKENDEGKLEIHAENFNTLSL